MAYDMDYSVLGRTGLKISRIGYGCAGLGNVYTPVEQREINECVAMAMDEYGINYFDVAPSYGTEGLSETRLGIALQGRRQDIVLTTKMGRFDHGQGAVGEYEFDYTPQRVRTEVENSLRRLKTDYIDVYQLHDIEASQYLDYLVEETIPAMEKLRTEGKIRYIGITDGNLEVLKYTAERSPSVDSILTCCRYTLMDHTLDGFFEELRSTRNIGVVNSSVTFLGLLTTEGSTMGDFGEQFPEFRQVVLKVIDLCNEHGVDLGELAVMFGCHCDSFDSTLISMARKKRLLQNMALYKREYDKELCQQVYTILKDVALFPKSKIHYHKEDAKAPGYSN